MSSVSSSLVPRQHLLALLFPMHCVVHVAYVEQGSTLQGGKFFRN